MSDIEVTRDAGVLTITLRRTDKKNALTGAMYETMISAFNEADGDAGIGAIVLRGSAGRVECVEVSSYSSRVPVCLPSWSPGLKKAVRSATRAACCMLWVTMTIV